MVVSSTMIDTPLKTQSPSTKSSEKNNISNDGPQYHPPKSGVLSHIPHSWVPYAELMRISKPTGILMIWLPHVLGTLYVSASSPAHASLAHLLYTNTILFVYAFFLRSTGCAWNDLQDIEFDRQVRRCRNRPLARGAISPFQGFIFSLALTGICMWILSTLPKACYVIAVPSWFGLIVYPFAKRVTDFPQVVLGMQLATGLGMGMVGLDADALSNTTYDRKAMVSFYTANVAWTLVYDFIYAQMDLEDDVKAGVKSMAVRFQKRPKTLLVGIVGVMVCMLGSAGWWQGFGMGYFGVACGGTAGVMVWMLGSIDIRSLDDCRW
jgi:4-hydroxybenzoate polyprenyltransferase